MKVVFTYEEACEFIASKIDTCGASTTIHIQKKKRKRLYKGSAPMKTVKGEIPQRPNSLVEYLDSVDPHKEDAEAFAVAEIMKDSVSFKTATAIYRHWPEIAVRARKFNRVPTPVFEDSHSDVVTGWLFGKTS